MILKFIYFIWMYIFGALAGSYAGANNTEKSIRRLGIPIVLTLSSLVFLVANFGAVGFWALTIMSMSGVFSLGYGIPDETDEGSFLGRVWYEITGHSHFWADVLTRATIAIACCISILSIALVGKIMVAYLIGCVIIICSYIGFGAIIEKEGTFIFLGKECLYEEAYIYGIICAVVSGLLLLI